MPAYALDSSALLSIIFEEAGGETVAAILADCVISSVNLTEVISTLCDRGMPDGEISFVMAQLCPEVVAFDAAQARLAGGMRRQTRSRGLSLGDRACLALASVDQRVAITADRAWTALDLGVKVELIR